jgi:hypothetical protein
VAQVDARRSPRATNTRRPEQIAPVRSFQNNVHVSVRAGWSAAGLSNVTMPVHGLAARSRERIWVAISGVVHHVLVRK